MSSRRYRVDQEMEIFNFRVVPDLQISKNVRFLMVISCVSCDSLDFNGVLEVW